MPMTMLPRIKAVGSPDHIPKVGYKLIHAAVL
jgi:hypothetical protein